MLGEVQADPFCVWCEGIQSSVRNERAGREPLDTIEMDVSYRAFDERNPDWIKVENATKRFVQAQATPDAPLSRRVELNSQRSRMVVVRASR
jgi:hypothetical protein